MGTRMLQRRGTSAEWTAANPILGEGELGLNKTTGEVRIGDGASTWSALPTSKIFLPRATLDTLYSPVGAVPATIVDAAGDILVGSGADTIIRLPKGADNQRLTVVAGAVVWADLPNSFAVIDAIGDILVGSGPDAVAKLPKGANNTVLTVDGTGTVVWAAPSGATDNTKVLKSGDTMTGDLVMDNTKSTRYSGQAGTNVEDIVVFKNAGATALLFRKADRATKVPIDAARIDGTSLYDNGNRVYSASNPPPASGMSLLLVANLTNITNGGYFTVGTFVAPPSGKVKIHAHIYAGLAANINVSVTLDTGVNVYHVAAVDSSQPVDGEIGYSGLTPGATYTLKAISSSAGGPSASFTVEG